MSEVSIEYCVPCGFRQRAIEVEEAILNGVESELDELSLIMGDHGVFRVSVDGDTVFDKDEDDFDVDDIVRAVRDRL